MEHLSPDSQLKNVRHHPSYLPTAKQFLKHSFDSHAYCRYIPASRRSQSLWVQPFKFHATAIAGAAGAVQIAALNALKINIYDLLQVPFRDIAPDVCTSFRRSLNLLLDCLLLALCADLTTIQLLALQCLQGLFRLAAHFEEKQGAMKLFATTLIARGLATEVRKDVRLACLRNLPLLFIPEGFAGDRPPSRFVAAFDILLAGILRCDTHASLAAVAFRELLALLDPDIARPIIERWMTECPELVTSARSVCEQLMDDLISKIPNPRLDSAVPSEPCDPQKAEDELAEGSSCKDDDEEDTSRTASPRCPEPEYPSNPLWSHYHFSYSDVSFLLSRAQFEALTGCMDFFKGSRRAHCGKDRPTSKEVASSLIDSVSAFLSSAPDCSTLFLRVQLSSRIAVGQTPQLGSKADQSEEKAEILLRTPRLTALCALLQLLLLDSNFNLVLFSLSAHTRLLSAVHQQQSQSMTREQVTSLLDERTGPLHYHRTDGHAWLSRHSVACLRTALADAKMVVRVEGSRLAAALTRLPGGCMALVRGLTAPLLAPNLAPAAAQQRSPAALASRLRQEAFDALTVALLSDIANVELDLDEICQSVLVPGLLDEKPLVRDAAIDCLEAVAHRLGDSNLHAAYAAISSAEDRLLASLRVSKPSPGQAQNEANNNNLQDSVAAGHCAVEERQSLAVQQEVLAFFDDVRARVHRRLLPKQDSQGRIVRPASSANPATGASTLSARMCAAEASAARGGGGGVGETVEYEAAPLAERRKPSAGRLRGSKRLPWDPRDEVVNLAATAPMSLSHCSPASAQASPVAARRSGSRLSNQTPAGSKSKPRKSNVTHNDANSADTAQPQGIFNMAPLSDDSLLCRRVQNNYQSETFPRKSTNPELVAGSTFGQHPSRLTNSALVSSSHVFDSPSSFSSNSFSSAPMSRSRFGSLGSVSTTFPPGWLDSHRLSTAPKTPTTLPDDPTEAHALGDPPEVSGIRNKASIRRALRVFTETDSAGTNGGSPELPGTPSLLTNTERESGRIPRRNGNLAMPLLSTGRTTFPSPSAGAHGSGSFGKNLNCEGLMAGRFAAAAGHRRAGASDTLHTPSERRPLRGQHDISPTSPRFGLGELSANNHPSPPDVLKAGPTRPSREGDQSFNIVGRSMHPADAPECTKTTVAGFEYLDPDERPIRGVQSNSAIGLSGISPFSDDGNLRWSLESQKQSESDREDKGSRNGAAGRTLGEGDSCSDFAANGFYGLASEYNSGKVGLPARPIPRSESQPLNRNRDTDLTEEKGPPVWQSPARTRIPPPGRRKRSSSNHSRRPGAPPQSPSMRSESASKTHCSPSAALNMLASTDWEEKVNGLTALSDLVTQNPAAFTSPSESISQVVIAVTSECRNLRSQVSRQAVKTLAALFRGLGRSMDPHIEVCVRVLLGKTGEASAAFLRGEVAIALDDLTRSANPTRALLALLQHGLGHKNPSVRRQCAIQVCHITERLGGVRILQSANSASRGTSGGLSSWGSMHAMGSSVTSSAAVTGPNSSQVVAERVIHALGRFLLDGNQETRYYGRKILSILQQSPDFERVLTRYLSGQALRAVREATEYLHTKGLGEPPMATASASSVRSPDSLADATLSRGCSAGLLGGPNVGI